jgi:hypothetical protein
MLKSAIVVIILQIISPSLLLAQSNFSTDKSPLFIMNSIGSIGNIISQSPTIYFKSITSCIDVRNGIELYSGVRANGQFTIKCEVAQSFNSLGIRLYPNPAINNTKLQVDNTPPNDEIFSLRIWTVDGQLLSTRKETGNNIMRGINIDLIGLSYGTYILRIESAKSVDVIKFVKAQ